LTCVEYGDGKRCTKPCEAGDSCGAGLSCTDLHLGSAKMGTYCWD
jgi:hypothetical protein